MPISEKIIKAQRELLAIFDSIPEPICIIDESLSIKRLNMAMAEIIGLDIKSALGSRCYKHLVGRDEPCQLCYFKRNNGSTRYLECNFMELSREGKDSIFELTIYPYPDAGENSAIFHFRNIFDKVKLERHLERLSELLSKSVGEKDSEVREDKEEVREDHRPFARRYIDTQPFKNNRRGQSRL